MSLNGDDFFKDSEVQLDDNEEEEEEEEDDELVNLDKENEDLVEDEEEDQDEEDDNEEDDIEEDDEEEHDEEEGRTAAKHTTAISEKTQSNDLQQPTLTDDESKLQSFYKQLQIKAKIADTFEINPTVAIPYASDINTVALSNNSKWLFTGGEDGYIRKYDFFASVDGEVLLTAAQKHSLVDSITNGGSLVGYWENEIPVKRSSVAKDMYLPILSPVFSLQVEKSCLWLLSGLKNGGVNLQSIRHNEGAIVHHFSAHTDAVSCLRLNQAQDKFISGSWDTTISQHDLQTGNQITQFAQATGQISSLEYRPTGGIEVEQIKQNANTGEDDDMDSLFGDDDEVNKPNEATKESAFDENVFMSSSIDGSINVWDLRTQSPVIKIRPPKGTPPWCVSACWSVDGNSIFAGRRNSTVEELSLKMPFTTSGEPKPATTLKFPSVSGAVTLVRALPNGNHVICGSYDNIRMYDLRLHSNAHKRTPFMIVPGHHGGVISDVQFDPTYRYMISSSGNRGWEGSSTENVLVYEVRTE